MYTWGRAGNGRLGQSLTADLDCQESYDDPKRVIGALSEAYISDVACGRFHMLALSDNGEVFAWGDNKCGQIGLSSSPLVGQSLRRSNSNGNTAGIRATSCTSLSRKSSREKTAIDISPLIRSVAKTLIVSGGEVGCFGGRMHPGASYQDKPGETATNEKISVDFVPVQDLSFSVFSPRLVIGMQPIVVKAIACGSFHCLCLSVFGKVYSWGRGANGRLGQPLGALKGRRDATDGMPCLHEDDLSYGEPCAVVFPWMESEEFEMVHDSISPVSGNSIVSIAAGDCHSLAVTSGGHVYSWGSGGYGRLGHGDHLDEYLPKCVSALYDSEVKVKSIAAGSAHSIFLSENGQMFGCGYNHYKEVDSLPLPCHLASSSRTDKMSILFPLPILVKSFPGCFQEAVAAVQGEGLEYTGETVVKIACGGHHTIAITALDSVYAWGMGYSRRPPEGASSLNENPDAGCRSPSDSTGAHQFVDAGLICALSGFFKKKICANVLGKDFLQKKSIENVNFVSGGNFTMFHVWE